MKKPTKRPPIRRIDVELELHRLEERCDAIEQSMFWLSKPLTEIFARKIVEGLFTGEAGMMDGLILADKDGSHRGRWSFGAAVHEVVRVIDRYFAESIEAAEKINRRGRRGARRKK